MKQTFELSPNDSKGWDAVADAICKAQEETCVITIEVKKQRTKPQNRSIHLFCTMLADRLNSTGMDMVRSIKILRKSPEVAIPWTPEAVKKWLWHPVQKAMFDIESTTELDTRQVDQVKNVLNKNLADKLGVSCDFPSARG